MSAEKLDLKFNLYSCLVVPQHFVIKRTKKAIFRQGGIAVLKATTSAHKRKLANQVDRLDLFCIPMRSGNYSEIYPKFSLINLPKKGYVTVNGCYRFNP